MILHELQEYFAGVIDRDRRRNTNELLSIHLLRHSIRHKDAGDKAHTITGQGDEDECGKKTSHAPTSPPRSRFAIPSCRYSGHCALASPASAHRRACWF